MYHSSHVINFSFFLYQVAGAVVKSGGEQIQIESDEFVAKNGPVKTGEIAVTGPGNLPCKIVIHAVGRILCFIDSVCRNRRHHRVVEMGWTGLRVCENKSLETRRCSDVTQKKFQSNMMYLLKIEDERIRPVQKFVFWRSEVQMSNTKY